MENENFESIGGEEYNGRRCSEDYSCVEDMYYFMNLAIPFIN
ncbi:MAG: hypothetical protein ACFFCV_04350 [Promethearchaeota archaeon]